MEYAAVEIQQAVGQRSLSVADCGDVVAVSGDQSVRISCTAIVSVTAIAAIFAVVAVINSCRKICFSGYCQCAEYRRNVIVIKLRPAYILSFKLTCCLEI